MIKTFAEAERVLAQRLPGYTERPQQQALAAFVEQVITDNAHGLAEAGCGTGKSLATMIPAILSGKKTVVATATKALMEQYATKDVPFLQEHLGVPFTWALVKGRSNYFCRAKAVDPDMAPKAPHLAAMLAEIDANPDHSGDFEHFEVEVPDMERWALSTSSAECPGKRDCPFGEVCFAEKAKKAGREAQVVITNTAMLMTDLKVRELSDGVAAMLGNYELVLIDEGHETESYATNALTSEIKRRGIEMLVGEAQNFADSLGTSLKNRNTVMQALEEAWGILSRGAKQGEVTPRSLRFFMEHSEPFLVLVEALNDMADEITALVPRDQKGEVKRNRLAKRAKNAATTIGLAVTSTDEEYVRWVETAENKRTRQTEYTFNIAPVHVGSFLSEWLWNEVSAVLLSATLSVKGDFGFIKDRLSMPADTRGLSVGTPFDYNKQALLFVPPASAPSPAPKTRSAWLGYATATTLEMVKATGGGALLLFTSRSAMEQAYNTMAPVFEGMGLTCLIQTRDANKKALAKTFQEDTDSVLFGLSSFMTGVDFQGDACRLVVIDKLPFPVPSEPITAARCNLIKKSGRNDFTEFTIPLMTLVLEQAYGRLIRTATDRGVVAILDSRLTSTGYGKTIVRSLPTSPVTSDLGQVQEFFSS